MKKMILPRIETSDEGTFGFIKNEDGEHFECRTLELPWRGNDRGVSCIPAGVYLFKWRTDSPKHGECYEEWDDPATERKEDVPDRDRVQIHAANLAGDKAKGYVAQLLGCIAPGEAVVDFKAGTKPAGDKNQRGVASSGAALKRLVEFLGKETFQLTVVWNTENNPKAATEA